MCLCRSRVAALGPLLILMAICLSAACSDLLSLHLCIVFRDTVYECGLVQLLHAYTQHHVAGPTPMAQDHMHMWQHAHGV